MLKFRPILFVALASLLLVSAVRADESEMYDQGSFTLYPYGAYTRSITSRHERLPSVGVGGMYYWRNRIGLGAEVYGMQVEQPGDDTGGAGLSLMVRYHVLHFGRFTGFVDASTGPVELDERTPHEGSHFNFISRIGGGFTVPLGDNVDLMAGMRWYHLSNGRLYGADRNPGINAYQTFVGVVWSF